MCEVLFAQVLSLERAAARTVDTRISRDAVQVLVGQQALCQCAEGDAAHAGVIQRVEQVFFHPAVQQAVRRLVDQRRHAHVFQNGRCFACFGRRIAADADVQGLALLHGAGQGSTSLFQRGVGVEAVRVKNVHIVQAHAFQALVQTGQQVFA